MPKHEVALALAVLEELQTHLSSSQNLSNFGILIGAHFTVAGPFPLLPEEKIYFSLFEKLFLFGAETHARRFYAHLSSLERHGNVQSLPHLGAGYLWRPPPP